jgi:hypothetical protein
MPEIQRCEFCKYVKGFGDVLTCRRYPPTNQSSWDHYQGLVVVWIRVNANDWCGEYKESENA